MILLLIGSPSRFQFGPCPAPRAVQVKPVRLLFCLLSIFSPGRGFPVSLTGAFPRSRYRVILALVFLFHAFSLLPCAVFNVRPEARARKPVPGSPGIIAGASPCFDDTSINGACPFCTGQYGAIRGKKGQKWAVFSVFLCFSQKYSVFLCFRIFTRYYAVKPGKPVFYYVSRAFYGAKRAVSSIYTRKPGTGHGSPEAQKNC